VLSGQRIRVTADAVVSTLLTIVGRPLVALLIVRATGLTGLLAGEAVLLMDIPAGFLGILLGIGYRSRSTLAGTTVLLSTVGSAVTLALAIAVSPHL
jgi:predicted permease